MTWKLSRNLLIVIATLFTGTGIFVGGFVTGARYYDLLPIVIPRSDHVIGLDTIEIKRDAASTPE